MPVVEIQSYFGCSASDAVRDPYRAIELSLSAKLIEFESLDDRLVIAGSRKLNCCDRHDVNRKAIFFVSM